MRRMERFVVVAWLVAFGVGVARPVGAQTEGAPPVVGAPVVLTGDKVSLEQARTLLERGEAVVFDIRETKEHQTGVAPGMRLLPMSSLVTRTGEIPKDPKQPVLLICNTQNRSAKTQSVLKTLGYTNVRYVEGGMSEWAKRGWPLQAPR